MAHCRCLKNSNKVRGTEQSHQHGPAPQFCLPSGAGGAENAKTRNGHCPFVPFFAAPAIQAEPQSGNFPRPTSRRCLPGARRSQSTGPASGTPPWHQSRGWPPARAARPPPPPPPSGHRSRCSLRFCSKRNRAICLVQRSALPSRRAGLVRKLRGERVRKCLEVLKDSRWRQAATAVDVQRCGLRCRGVDDVMGGLPDPGSAHLVSHRSQSTAAAAAAWVVQARSRPAAAAAAFHTPLHHREIIE